MNLLTFVFLLALVSASEYYEDEDDYEDYGDFTHHEVKHALKYLYATHADGLYFWRTAPRPEFKEGPLPRVNSNKQDLLLDMTRPEHDANVMHAYTDSDWATCVKMHHCIQMQIPTYGCRLIDRS